jgi:hypothetical protein
VVGDGRVATLQFLNPNRAPVVNMAGPYSGTEGTPVAFVFSATDADGDALSYSWDLGDGTTGSGPTPPASHTYADNATYVVALSASDGKALTDTKTTLVTIVNVAPTITTGGLTGPPSLIPLRGGSASAPVTLAFTDPAGAQRHLRFAGRVRQRHDPLEPRHYVTVLGDVHVREPGRLHGARDCL